MEGQSLHGLNGVLVSLAPARRGLNFPLGVHSANRGHQQHLLAQGIIGPENLVFEGRPLAHHVHLNIGKCAAGENNEGQHEKRYPFHVYSSQVSDNERLKTEVWDHFRDPTTPAEWRRLFLR